MRTDRRWSRAVLFVALLLVGGCTATQHESGPPPTVTGRPPAHPPSGGATPAAVASALKPGFAELAAGIPATIGIAFAPVGTDAVSSLGAWEGGVAWSTIKVPLAIAALRADRARARPLATKAITQSDNAAAERLWAQLGPPEQAALQVQAVLREDGDAATMVESRRVRPGFTAFGQSQWALTRQAQFAAHLPCMADAGPVVDMMHNLVAGQRWGLAGDGAAAKGGWGPDQDGGYLVRQFGIVATESGQTGVALSADAASFDDGVAALDRMAAWLTKHKSELPGGHCPG